MFYLVLVQNNICGIAIDMHGVKIKSLASQRFYPVEIGNLGSLTYIRA
ncbi:hypothetical protein ACFLVJ_03700 [Chloroflexota bacterium]